MFSWIACWISLNEHLISYQTIPKFNVPVAEFYLKHCNENEKLLITCNFFLSYISFLPICELLTFSFTNFVVSIIFQVFKIRGLVID